MITAIILAAGESKRMGQPKMLLPWEGETVLAHVISVIQSGEMEDILVVTGGVREQVEEITRAHNVPTVFNSDFARGEMLSSLQCGLRELGSNTEAVLICLGDQPQMEERSVRLIIEEYKRTGAALIVPSYEKRRGHPWLLGRAWWNEVIVMRTPESPRDFLNRHAQDIHYLNVDSPSVLADLDTFEDYLNAKP